MNDSWLYYCRWGILHIEWLQSIILKLFLSTSQVVHVAFCKCWYRYKTYLLIFHQIALIVVDAEKQMLEARISELTSDNKVLYTQLKEKDECENNE